MFSSLPNRHTSTRWFGGFASTGADLDHAVSAPPFHPHDGALLVQGRVGLTVEGEGAVGVIHDQHDVQIAAYTCGCAYIVDSGYNDEVRISKYLIHQDEKKNSQ